MPTFVLSRPRPARLPSFPRRSTARPLFQYPNYICFRGGGPAIANLLGGQVDIFCSPMAIAIAHIQAGKLRALAVTSATRSDALPKVPTAREFVSGYESSY